MDYKRFISYLYSYIEGKKGVNVGYIRCEQRQGICRFTLNIQDRHGIEDGRYKVYLYKMTDEGVPIGYYLDELILHRFGGDMRKQTNSQNVWNTGNRIEDFDGVIAIYDANHIYVSQWSDEVVNTYQFITWQDWSKKKKAAPLQSAKVEVKAVQPDSVQTGYAEVKAVQEASLPTENVERKAAQVESVPAESVEQKAVQEASVPAESVEQKAVQEASVPTENVGQKAVQEASVPTENVEQKAVHVESVQSESVEQKAVQGASVPTENVEQKAVQSDSVLLGNEELKATQENQVSTEDISKGEEKDTLTAHEKKTPTISSLTIRLMESRPKLPDFENHEIYDCVRIEPNDIGLLEMENWRLGVNSFLTHGFYNYKYLMLGKQRFQDGAVKAVLGVPGVYDNKEQYIAKIFGFEVFVPVKHTNTKTGNFGYWIVELV